MITFDEIRNAVGESSELSLDGRQKEALALLDRALTKAERSKSETAVTTLAMHASAISQSIGDLQAAKLYLEQVLRYEPANPLALYSTAHILKKQGKIAEAREIANGLYSSVRTSDTQEAKGLQELLACEWPEISHRTG